MPRLFITKGASYFKEYQLRADEIVTIGRARTGDIVLADPKVSRYHAAIVPAPGTGEHYFIRDLSSVYLTRLNGKSIHQRLLQDGDRVQIADYELQYKDQTSSMQGRSLIRLVSKQSDAMPAASTTVIVVRRELEKEIPGSMEKRELVEDITNRAA